MKYLILLVLLAYSLDAEVTSVGKKVVGVKGTLLCGAKPAENVKVRLFRVQPGKKDDVSQILDETLTGPSGMFHVEGNTNGFALNETDISPVISVYHKCDEDPKKIDKAPFRRFNYIVPTDYVTLGAKAKKAYDLGTLNIQLEFPNEKKEKTIVEKPAAF